MKGVSWIKIATDIFDDEKILLIEQLPEADSLIVIWFKLLSMAGKTNNNGVFMLTDRIAYTEEMLAAIFRRPINTVRLALDTFEKFGMIVRVENVLTIPNWVNYQNADKLEKIREQNKERQRRFKERHSGVLIEDNTEEIEDTEENIELKEEKKSNKRFVKPTIEELKEYCKEKGYTNVNPEKFYNYYESNGWKVGKNKMVSWKHTLANWNSSDFNKNNYGKSGVDKSGADKIDLTTEINF